jgi:hypothetical protein
MRHLSKDRAVSRRVIGAIARAQERQRFKLLQACWFF